MPGENGMLKKIAKGLWETAKIAGEVVVVTGKGVATAGAAAKDFVEEHKDEIKSATAAATNFAGATLEVGGDLAKTVFRNGKEVLLELGQDSTNPVTRVAAKTLGGVAAVGEGVAGVTEKAGKGTRKVSRATGEVLGSLVLSGTSMASNAVDSVAVSKSDIEKVRKQLLERGEAILKRSDMLRGQIKSAVRRKKRQQVIDSLMVGGVSLSSLVGGDKVPPDVQAAFEAAYPNLASAETFAEAAARLPADKIEGLVSGVKGKLFEMKFVDELNSGGLPDGFTARIADSATQQGWDIQIVDRSGRVAEALQAKATESVSYVQDALEQYPGIDVVTTSETFAALTAAGAAESVRDGGFSEAALDVVVSEAAGIGAGISLPDFAPSALGLAVIALTAFMDRSITPEERASSFGARVGQAGIASALGHGVMLATGTWWLALIGGVGSHWLAANGRDKRAQLDQLKAILKDLKKAETRINRLLPIPAQ
jgi:hypothetical protein